MITIKLECSQGFIMIDAKLMELLLGIIFPTAKNRACRSGRNVTKLAENVNYY